MIRVLFICHGNICRSTMAQFVFQDMVNHAGLADEFFIDSKATSTEEIGNPPHRGTVRKMNELGIPMQPHFASQGFGTGDPSATDFYIIIGRTAARIDAHIGSKGFLCVCSLDGTYLTVISLCNVADDLIGKVSAFVQG